MKIRASCLAYALVLLCAAFSANAAILTKAPDQGDYWFPLSSDGTYVYANSFVAPNSGSVTAMGTWLNGGPTNLIFEILDSLNSDPTQGPDTSNVFAQTSVIAGQVYQSLTYVDGGSITNFASLVAGNIYWFAASTIGQDGTEGYNVGGHTQNSDGIVDNGTFWFSNDSSGVEFDGRNLTPEMAFSVTLASATIPEPTSWALLALALPQSV